MVTVPRAIPADAGRLVDFNRSLALETEGAELPFEVVRRGVDAVFADAHKGFYLVADA